MIYKPEIHDELIVRATKLGFNNSRIADLIGISRMCLYNWVKDNESLAEQIRAAKEQINIKATDKIIELMDSDDPKTALKSAIFWLSNRTDDWQNKTKIEIEQVAPAELTEAQISEYLIEFAKNNIQTIDITKPGLPNEANQN